MAATISFIVSGIQGNAEKPKIKDKDITITARRLLPRDDRASGAEKMVVESNEVARVELNNGFVLWTRADDLMDEHGA